MTKTKTTTIRINQTTKIKMDELKSTMGYDQYINYLIEYYMKH